MQRKPVLIPLLSNFFLIHGTSLIRLNTALAISFFPDPYQQHDPRNPCKNTDKLGSRQNSHTSTDNIPTEKLDHKPSNAIKDQITGSNLTIFFFVPCDQQQQKKMQKIQSARIQLRRDQRHVIGRIFGILKYHRKNTLCLFSITAARQETSDPSKSLGQCHRWQDHIRVFKKYKLSDPAIQKPRQYPADDTAKHHKTGA